AVPFERGLHRRPQDIVAFLVGDPPPRDDADDIVGQLLDKLDHLCSPAAATTPSVDTRRPKPAGPGVLRGADQKFTRNRVITPFTSPFRLASTWRWPWKYSRAIS